MTSCRAECVFRSDGMLNSDEAIVKVVKGDSQYIGAVFGGFWRLLDIQAKFRLSLGSVAKLPG